MNMKKIAAFFLVFMVAISTSPALSQAESRRAVDMVLVIDNSCSMFPRDQILPGCTAFGSDPELLRIIGADLFIARLGFAETNEGNYNLGVVGLGDEPQLLFPLQNLVGARDLAAKSIANPAPQLATKLIPALEMAYKELTTSVNSQASNMKAVVLLTDGVPYPRENQANADIERLIDNHSDIPLFVMLLQSSDKDLEAYNLFWEEMQSTKTHVYVSKVTDSTQIEQAYNSIVAKIQNTVPADGRVVSPNQPYKFFVSEDVQRIIITTVHPLGDSQSQVTVLDPEGKSISENEPGVTRFRGIDNPVEVISIFQPRLSDNLKNQTWVITSNAEVNVFLDRQGAYRVQFLAPDVSITDFSDSYIAIDSFSPAQDFEIKFNLLYSTGNVKTKPEKIVVKLVLPDGTQSILSNANLLQPDSNGVYTINFNPTNEYPDIENQTGKFIVTVDAGSADDQSLVTIPVSAAKILINFSPGPYIVSLNPPTLTCKDGQSAQFEVV